MRVCQSVYWMVRWMVGNQLFFRLSRSDIRRVNGLVSLDFVVYLQEVKHGAGTLLSIRAYRGPDVCFSL